MERDLKNRTKYLLEYLDTKYCSLPRFAQIAVSATVGVCLVYLLLELCILTLRLTPLR